MKNNNKESTRYWSDLHEKSVCKALNAIQQPNSGASKFKKGDVVIPQASILCECKTTMTEKASVSIKKEWIDKNKEEAFANRLSNSCICINFGPDTPNYYVISEKLMKVLVEALSDEE
jgi:Holliday junction resolvase